MADTPLSQPPSAIQSLIRRINAYERLIRLDKPIGILLLLWPTLWGLWAAAGGLPKLSVLMVFLVGTVLMRSAGCAINDYADRHFDGAVERTKGRPLATGEISPTEALVVAAALALLAGVLAIAALNRLSLYYAVGALLLAASYPFTKRFFALPQAYLGVAFNFGILMAFATVVYRVPPLAWCLFAAGVFWTVAYDTQYAMVDRDDDLKLGLKTSAIFFGRFDWLAIAICYGACLALLAWAGQIAQWGTPFYSGLAVASLLIIYYLWSIRLKNKEACFKSFINNAWFGLVVFVAIAADRYVAGGTIALSW